MTKSIKGRSMRRLQKSLFVSIALGMLVFSAMGCGAIEDVFEKEKEVTGLIEEVGADYLVVEAITYAVNEQTSFDGVSGLADLAVGTEVEISYEEAGNTRTALEVEVGGDND